MPMAPLPAKRSSTAASAHAPRLPRALKVASRTRSGVGPGAGPLGRDELAAARRTRDHAHRRRPYRGDRVRSCAMSEVGAARRRVVVVRIDQGHVRNAVNSDTAERLHDEPSSPSTPTTPPGSPCSPATSRRSAPAPTCATCRRLRDSGPLGPTRLQLSQAGDRRHRGLVRGRRRGAGGVVRPAGGGRVRPHRLPRAPLGRAAHRRRHLPAAADRRPRPGPRPHPHRPGDRRRGGGADGVRHPGRARRRGPRDRGRAGRRDRGVPVARRGERPPVASTPASASASTRRSPSRTSSAARRSSPTASARASAASTTTRPSATLTLSRDRGLAGGAAPPELADAAARRPADVVRQLSPSTALEGGALDVEGEQVAAAHLAHVEARAGRGTASHRLVLGEVVHLPRPAEELGLRRRSSLSASGVIDAAAGVAPQVLRLHRVRHAAHVEPAVVDGTPPRGSPAANRRSGWWRGAQPGRSRSCPATNAAIVGAADSSSAKVAMAAR